MNPFDESIKQLDNLIINSKKNYKEMNETLDKQMKPSEYSAYLIRKIEETEQILGKALGYAPYPIYNGYDCIKKQKTNEPDSNWVCIGEHTLETLAMEAADKIKELKNDNRNNKKGN